MTCPSQSFTLHVKPLCPHRNLKRLRFLPAEILLQIPELVSTLACERVACGHCGPLANPALSERIGIILLSRRLVPFLGCRSLKSHSREESMGLTEFILARDANQVRSSDVCLTTFQRRRRGRSSSAVRFLRPT